MKLTKRNFDVGNLNEELHIEHANKYIDNIKEALDSHVDAEVSYTTVTPAVPDTDFRILHGRGVKPSKFLVVGISKAGHVYLSPIAWTDKIAWFRCSVASATVTLLIW